MRFIFIHDQWVSGLTPAGEFPGRIVPPETFDEILAMVPGFSEEISVTIFEGGGSRSRVHVSGVGREARGKIRVTLDEFPGETKFLEKCSWIWADMTRRWRSGAAVAQINRLREGVLSLSGGAHPLTIMIALNVLSPHRATELQDCVFVPP